MRVLSLFSGIGGLDLGVKLALPEARVVGYVEKDDYCRRVLTARMADGWLDEAPIHGDITSFDGTGWRGAVDLVCGGFPCQDISNAGKRAGIQDDPTLEPALRLLAHGSPGRVDRNRGASRIDRLRALGNSVVPQCAAFALLTLVGRIEGYGLPILPHSKERED